jgi:aminoglycoside phosphotransferase (APT) family kinase protein
MYTPPEPTGVSPSIARAIVARLGLSPRPVTLLARGGSGNSAYLLGDDLVLRVPHADAARVAGAAREAVAVPVARAVGVRTPALVAFDDSCELLPVPYGVYERVPGVPLVTLALAPTTTPGVWRELGRDLAGLHTRVSRDGPGGRLWSDAIPDDPDPRPWAEELAQAGYFVPADAGWLRALLDQLAPLALAPAPWRFTHGDVSASNILVDPTSHTYLALIDWGGAGWSDPAWDFAPVSLWAAPFVLEGYRAVAPEAAPAAVRIAWRYTQLALFMLRHRHPLGSTNAILTATRLLGGLRFFLGEQGIVI